MSFSETIQAVTLNWHDEEFKKLHDPEFMFIRETELMTMDDWIANMKEFSSSGDYAKRLSQGRRTSLVHENRHVTEWRWEEGDELVTHVCMKKKGRAWRSIKTRGKDYDQAIHYGRLSGFFDDANKLTPSGSRMAVFLFDDCKAA